MHVLRQAAMLCSRASMSTLSLAKRRSGRAPGTTSLLLVQRHAHAQPLFVASPDIPKHGQLQRLTGGAGVQQGGEVEDGRDAAAAGCDDDIACNEHGGASPLSGGTRRAVSHGTASAATDASVAPPHLRRRRAARGGCPAAPLCLRRPRGLPTGSRRLRRPQRPLLWSPAPGRCPGRRGRPGPEEREWKQSMRQFPRLLRDELARRGRCPARRGRHDTALQQAGSSKAQGDQLPDTMPGCADDDALPRRPPTSARHPMTTARARPGR